MAKGELARQILNFKETEAGERRAVRGRQVLYLFDQHFKTNEEVSSLYSVEDLLKVNLLQDDLSTFIHNWESVVAGMSHVPDERTLRDIVPQLPGGKVLALNREAVEDHHPGTGMPLSGQDHAPGDPREGQIVPKLFVTTS